MKTINIIDALYVCRIDRVTDLLETSAVLELSSIKIDGNGVEVSVLTADRTRITTSINNLYNSRGEAERKCTQYNNSLWTQD